MCVHSVISFAIGNVVYCCPNFCFVLGLIWFLHCIHHIFLCTKSCAILVEASIHTLSVTIPLGSSGVNRYFVCCTQHLALDQAKYNSLGRHAGSYPFLIRQEQLLLYSDFLGMTIGSVCCEVRRRLWGLPSFPAHA